MSVLLHISDPHFGTEQAHVMAALLDLSHQQRPDLLVLCGDITQRACADQFRRARAFVDQLHVPLLAIPGNHDIPLFNLGARVLQPYARFSAAFGQDLAPEHESPDMLVLGVNTTRWYRHKNGEVSSEQIERVARRLASASPRQLRVVVVHHPVAVTRTEEAHNLLRGRHNALHHWADAGADLVLGGHIHLPYVLALAGLGQPMWAVQAGTAVSSQVRDGAPNSVNVLRWRGGVPDGLCLIERWNYLDTADAFVCQSVTDVRPDRDVNAKP
jgi:3',5'-cyclic AMP phosphodiesterase CpdA